MASLDALRGLNVAVMVLVNDLDGVRGVPAWARHKAAGLEGLTFVDLILPLFLFLLGASVPLALERRRARGEQSLRTVGHVLVRAASLLLMGVLMVNMPMAAEAAMGMRAGLWSLLVLLALLTLFHDGKAWGGSRWLSLGLRLLAGGAILALALRYRGLDNGQLVTLRPQWYGILGILGWAYLITSLVYLVAGGQRVAVLGVLGLLIVVHLGDRAGGYRGLGAWWTTVLGPALGPCSPIALTGLMAGLLLLPGSPATTLRAQAIFLLPLGMGLIIAGLGLRPLHPISKSTATPSFVLVAAGLCCPIYLGGRAVLEHPRVAPRLLALERLGQDALPAFLLPSLLYSAIDLYEQGFLNRHFGVGLRGTLRALVFTTVVLGLVALLRRARFRIRLGA